MYTIELRSESTANEIGTYMCAQTVYKQQLLEKKKEPLEVRISTQFG